jgi:alginate O-acetyltransferase complex protein AlgI
MVFSSVIFLFCFLPAVLTLHAIPGWRWRLVLLLAANLLFYSWGEGPYVVVLVASFFGNWLLGLLIRPSGEAGRRSRWLFVAGVVSNLGLLVYFKYAAFLVASLNTCLVAASGRPFPVPRIHLPIGISFFTFQALSYLVDVRRGIVPASRSLLDFAVYKSLFPQLIAGPIVRFRDVASQFTPHPVLAETFTDGIRRFVLGLGKKSLIANTVAVAADAVFGVPPADLSAGAAWLGVVCYALQIYFDFSGYSDMAIGLGKMLGFTFLENFDYPYRSTSVREFWRRWHISLSSWFRDYLYIPLGGSRMGTARTVFNLMTVFLLCGLWHGASWTFVVWGGWHGLFLALERTALGRRFQASPLRRLGNVYTLLVVLLGWVFFRADSLASAGGYLAALAGFGAATETSAYTIALAVTPKLLLAVMAGAVASFPVIPAIGAAASGEGRAPAFRWAWRFAGFSTLTIVFALALCALAAGSYNPFIYFRF